jgi:2-methylisocitrate lyase-like PEP mutase family enzyme
MDVPPVFFSLTDIRRPDTFYPHGYGRWINRIRFFFAAGADYLFTPNFDTLKATNHIQLTD